MRIVVASDSFKGCLTSAQVADAVEDGILEACPACQVLKATVADGGEGTAQAVVSALRGRMVAAAVHDPLGRRISASYGLVEADGQLTAVMEMAAASGLTLLTEAERDALRASSLGTGEMILDALQRGCRRFLVGIGGSATNDAGTGMLTALGYKFLDADGHCLDGCGASLGEIASIDATGADARLAESRFTVACDVDTPFCGPDGAACVFAPQKGASPTDVLRLDSGMRHLAHVIKSEYGTDITAVKGAGAAGGLGGAMLAFMGARLVPGIDMVLDVTGFDALLRGADMVITGEGRMDSQTPRGKTASGILRRARRMGVPVAALCGSVEPCAQLEDMGLAAIRCINAPGTPLAQAMQADYAASRIRLTAKELLNELKQNF